MSAVFEHIVLPSTTLSPATLHVTMSVNGYKLKPALRVAGIFLVFSLGLIQGCYSPQVIARSGPDRLERLSTAALCHSMTTRDRNDAEIRAELARRELFTDEEMQAIDQSKIFVGMSRRAFECSWPLPWHGNFIVIRVRAFAGEVEGRRRAVYEYTERVRYQELLPCEPPMAVFVEDNVLVGFLHGELPDEERRFDFEPAAWAQGSECAFLSHDY
jgi:hypothetical protein